MRTIIGLSLPLMLAIAAPGAARADDITAIGTRHHDRHWLVLDEHPEHGNLSARIRISDLDPSTPAGWAEMANRVSIGVWLLCDAAQDGPRVDGYFDAVRHECRATGEANSRAQMEQARDGARRGQAMAFIGLSRG